MGWSFNNFDCRSNAFDAACHYCSDRRPGCHDSCERYLQARDEVREVNTQKFRQMQNTIARPWTEGSNKTKERAQLAERRNRRHQQ